MPQAQQDKQASTELPSLTYTKSDCGTDSTQTTIPPEQDYESAQFWNMQVSHLSFIRLLNASESSLVWLARRNNHQLLAVKIVQRIQSEMSGGSPQQRSQGQGASTYVYGLSSQFVHQQNELRFIQSKSAQLRCMPRFEVIFLNEFILFVTQYFPLGSLQNYIYHYPINLSIKFGLQHLQYVAHSIKNIVLAVKEVHQIGYVHRDLKPDNILILRDKEESNGKRTKDILHSQIEQNSLEIQQNVQNPQIFQKRNYRMLLCDFNLITKIGQIDSSLCGTLEYMPPERLSFSSRSKKPVSAAVDIWSIGIILYEMMTGQVPFPGNDQEQILERILDRFIPEIDKIPEEPRQIINRCLQIEAEKRITAEQLLFNKFFSGAIQKLQSGQQYINNNKIEWSQ